MVNDPDEEATEYGGHPILQLWMNDPKEETTFFFESTGIMRSAS